ncbi:glycoside hydrolase family 5 protein [Mycena maculata]|uniref:mannan endo-1,4-beta-mannosidase n=1 Tax=Mycena maculata TaxID=230809 RepID=A0AAD7JYI2_9AGAR|nr:glycoside hydrolase family 5 protein [Mycena maculata]
MHSRAGRRFFIGQVHTEHSSVFCSQPRQTLTMFLSVVWLGVLGAVGVSATSSLDPRWNHRPRSNADPTPTTPAINKTQFVSTDGVNFKVNNSQFKFVGTNAYWLAALNTDQDIDSVLGNISQSNITVVRTWGFNDVPTIPENGTWFQLVANGTTSVNLNETNGLPKLDRIVSMAEKHGIYLLVSLTNNWNPLPSDNTTNSTSSQNLLKRDVATNNTLPRNTLSNDYGGMDAYVRAFGASTHDDFYTNATIIASFINYTTQVVQRYVNSTAILGWEIANDPRCNSSVASSPSCNTTTITAWHALIAQHIAKIDPNHLVSSGTQGFFCTDCTKLFQKSAPPPSAPSAAVKSRRNKIVPLTKKDILQEQKEARKKTRALQLQSGPPPDGVRVRGKWVATPTRRQDDVGVGSAFDGSTGVDSEDILSIKQIGFGSFQLFPDQNTYAPDDPNLSAFNNTLQAGLSWIIRHAQNSQMFGKPITLTGFGLVTQDNAPSFVPFNSTVAPFANDQFANITTSATQQPFGVTDQQRDDAYSQWLQQGILSGLSGMIQYQWGQGNLTAVNGTAISPTITENGIVPVQSENGISPSDGYSIAGVGQVSAEGTLQGAVQQFEPDT